jgi:hypothetical protein
VAVAILAKKVGNVLQRVQESQGLEITLDGYPASGEPAHGSAFSFLVERCATNLENGGRGIGNLLETVLVDALSRALWDAGLVAGSRAHISRIESLAEQQRYGLTLERR